MEQEYYGDVLGNDDQNGDPFVGAPARPGRKIRGTSRIPYLQTVQGTVTSTTLPSPSTGYAAARLAYFLQRMADFAPYRTSVFTAVPNASGVATVTINAEDLQTDTAYLAMLKLSPFVYMTFGASPTSAVPASQSQVSVSSFDVQGNVVNNSFAIERNTAQMTKVRFTNWRLLFGKPVADDIGLYPVAALKPFVLSVTGLVGNANFSVELPGMNDPRLAQAYSSLNS